MLVDIGAPSIFNLTLAGQYENQNDPVGLHFFNPASFTPKTQFQTHAHLYKIQTDAVQIKKKKTGIPLKNKLKNF